MRAGIIGRFVLAVVAFLSVAAAARADDGQSPHIKARLVSDVASVQSGEGFRLGIDYTSAPGWHTYWINAGDTGLAPRVKWNLPDGFSAGELHFPLPQRLPDQGLMSYAYEGRTVLLADLRAGGHFSVGDTLPLKAHIDFLVCKDTCIPESLEVATTIKVGPTRPGPDAGALAAAAAKVPPATAVTGTIDIHDGQAEMGFPLSDATPKDAYFFPATTGILSAPAAQALDVGPKGFSLRTQALDKLPAEGLTGIVTYGGKAVQITLRAGALASEVHGLGAAPEAKADTSVGGVLLAMVFAFVGGLILNLMPCVFPVLSMKLFSLTRAGSDGPAARSESLVYGAGAVVSFVVLALALDVLHRLGASLGWGFQLQSPLVVAVLAVVMLLVALNMSGVFEVGQSLQGIGAGAFDQKRPRLSAFLTGVLAVVVAAPCTAPFMATAIGVALAQGGLTSFVIFLALGIGFALPFVALTFLVTLVPGVAARLPRPGTWMDRLKLGLSLLMYVAVVWLVWVFAQQKGGLGGILLFMALLLVTAAVLPRLPRFARMAAGIAAVAVTVVAAQQAYNRFEANWSADRGEAEASENPKTYFSFQRLADARTHGQAVLVDMTAAWCVTCKVNEVGVLNTREVVEVLRKTNTEYMVGDWTNQDAEISRYLSLFGRSGVPLYVYYGPNNAEPKVLPQILNSGDMIRLINGGT